MTISCKLNSMNNLRLLSYFIPERFDTDLLRKSRLTDVTGALITFLKPRLHTYNIHYDNKTIVINQRRFNEQENNFSKMDSFNLSEIAIDYNELDNYSYLNLFTDNINYENCEILDFKVNQINKIKSVLCKTLNGKSSYIVCDTFNEKLCVLDETELTLGKRLLERI